MTEAPPSINPDYALVSCRRRIRNCFAGSALALAASLIPAHSGAADATKATPRPEECLDVSRLNSVSEDERTVLRLEWKAGLARAEEGRLLMEMSDRIERMKNTTHDIYRLIEAMPAGVRSPDTISSAPTAAAPPPVALPTAALPPVAAVAPPPEAVKAAAATSPEPPAPPVKSPAATVPSKVDHELDDPDNPADDSASLRLAALAAGGVLTIAAIVIGLRRRTRKTSVTRTPTESLPTDLAANSEGAETITRDAPDRHQKTPSPMDEVMRMTAAAMSLPPSTVSDVTPARPSASPPTAANGASATNQPSVATAVAKAVTTAEMTSKSTAATVNPVNVAAPVPSAAAINYDQTLELAEIMLSMGLASGAATALLERIRTNPRSALPHWLKLLDVYREDGHRADFDRVAKELLQNFNICANDWLRPTNAEMPTLEKFDRVMARVQELWNQPAACIDYLSLLLEDNREGMRAGFPQPVAEEMLLLIGMLKDLGASGTGASPDAPPAQRALSLAEA